MTQRVSQAKKRKSTTHEWTPGRKMCRKQPQRHLCLTNTHTCTHTLLLRATIVQKELWKQPTTALLHNRGIVIFCWLCQQLREERERERDSFQHSANTALPNVQSQLHILWSRHFFASTLYGPRVQWSLIYRDLQGLVNYVQNFEVSIVGIFVLFCSQPQGGFTVLCEASNTFGAHCCGKLGKKRST